MLSNTEERPHRIPAPISEEAISPVLVTVLSSGRWHESVAQILLESINIMCKYLLGNLHQLHDPGEVPPTTYKNIKRLYDL